VESSGRESESIVGRICEKWALRREWKSEGVIICVMLSDVKLQYPTCEGVMNGQSGYKTMEEENGL